MLAERVAHGLNAKKSGTGWIARCVAHDDKDPSLSLSTGADGKILVHCHAGCSQTAVVAALRQRGLWPETRPEKSFNGTSKITACYNYTDEHGGLLYQVVRREPGRGGQKKDFLQRYPDGAGGWVWKKYPQQVLYRVPEVTEAPIVFVCEGEKDCETLRDHGFVATTNAGGATAEWLPSYTETLRGRDVILIPDRDRPGYTRVKRIARELVHHVTKLVYLELEDGRDVTEWFQRGHSELELIAQLEDEKVSK